MSEIGLVDRRGFLKAVGGAVVATAAPAPTSAPDNSGRSSKSLPRMAITAELATWASGVRYQDLSPEAVHQAKRFLLDSLGCALGGYRHHDVMIALGVLAEIGASGPATVIGSGKEMDVVSASLANALMVRSMEYNDIYWKQDPSHPSDIIPAALACAERAKSGGRELIVGIALGYELECRMCEAAFPGIRDRGWHHATLTAFVSPVVAARMLHLSSEQMQHAIGISGSARCTLGAVTAGRLTMMKNTVDHLATQSGVFAALLAERGYTGPEHVIDGKEGLVYCFGPKWKLEVLTEGLGASWRITQCGMKFFPTEALTHTPISAVLDLVVENDLKPEQIAAVHIGTLARAADILADPSKYDPRSAETAGHSLPYCIAAAIVHRQVTPAQFTMASINDPLLRAQMPKIKVNADPAVEKLFPALQRAVVRVETVNGRTFSRTVDFPKGDARNPLTDQEIAMKFSALAEGVLTQARQRAVIDAVWNLESIATVSALMRQLAADVTGPK